MPVIDICEVVSHKTPGGSTAPAGDSAKTETSAPAAAMRPVVDAVIMKTSWVVVVLNGQRSVSNFNTLVAGERGLRLAFVAAIHGDRRGNRLREREYTDVTHEVRVSNP